MSDKRFQNVLVCPIRIAAVLVAFLIVTPVYVVNIRIVTWNAKDIFSQSDVGAAKKGLLKAPPKPSLTPP